MSNKDTILMDIQQHNDAQDMSFEWKTWNIRQKVRNKGGKGV